MRKRNFIFKETRKFNLSTRYINPIKNVISTGAVVLGKSSPANNIPIDSKYKYIQSLNESADRLLLNAELMDLESYCEQALLEANMNLEDLSSKIHGYLDENRN